MGTYTCVVPFRRDDDGSVVEVLGVLRDITDVVIAEERLTHDALHDSLTGLPNRAPLLDRLETALDRSVREGREIAVLFCDLDGSKYVNDSAGYAAVDFVLIETATRLRKLLRAGDTWPGSEETNSSARINDAGVAVDQTLRDMRELTGSSRWSGENGSLIFGDTSGMSGLGCSRK